DLIVGAPHADPFGPNDPFNYRYAGVTYVVFGGVDLGSNRHLRLSPAAPYGAHGFVLDGISDYGRSATSVSGAGEFNGDGIDDLIVGAPFASPNGLLKAGRSYIVFGAPDLGVGARTFISLGDLNGSDGFALDGTDYHGESGTAASGARDVNGDGFD